MKIILVFDPRFRTGALIIPPFLPLFFSFLYSPPFIVSVLLHQPLGYCTICSRGLSFLNFMFPFVLHYTYINLTLSVLYDAESCFKIMHFYLREKLSLGKRGTLGKSSSSSLHMTSRGCTILL